MLVVKIKDNEPIDKALKRFKKKFEKTGVLKTVRNKAYFEKPSVTRRNVRLRAIYKQQIITSANS